MLTRQSGDTDTHVAYFRMKSHMIFIVFTIYTLMQCFNAHKVCTYSRMPCGKAVTDKIKLSTATRHEHVFDLIPYITLNNKIYITSMASSINLLNLFAHTLHRCRRSSFQRMRLTFKFTFKDIYNSGLINRKKKIINRTRNKRDVHTLVFVYYTMYN